MSFRKKEPQPCSIPFRRNDTVYSPPSSDFATAWGTTGNQKLSICVVFVNRLPWFPFSALWKTRLNPYATWRDTRYFCQAHEGRLLWCWTLASTVIEKHNINCYWNGNFLKKSQYSEVEVKFFGEARGLVKTSFRKTFASFKMFSRLARCSSTEKK